jgi:hypothetical protein
MRHSLTDKRNPAYHDVLEEMKEAKDWDNLAFFGTVKTRLQADRRPWPGAIGMVGGTSLPAHRLRQAQAVLRWDLRPSYWSHCFLIAGEAPAIDATPVWECTLEPAAPEGLVPERSGVTVATLGRYRDAAHYPNVAVISFALAPSEVDRLLERARDPNIERIRFNLWALLGRWLPYAFGMDQGPNPLAEGVRLPAAGYAEMAYEAVAIDLTPGAAERNSSPEHFWQTALWWWKPFEELGKGLRIDHGVREKQATIAKAMSTRLPMSSKA